MSQRQIGGMVRLCLEFRFVKSHTVCRLWDVHLTKEMRFQCMETTDTQERCGSATLRQHYAYSVYHESETFKAITRAATVYMQSFVSGTGE